MMPNNVQQFSVPQARGGRRHQPRRQPEGTVIPPQPDAVAAAARAGAPSSPPHSSISGVFIPHSHKQPPHGYSDAPVAMPPSNVREHPPPQQPRQQQQPHPMQMANQFAQHYNGNGNSLSTPSLPPPYLVPPPSGMPQPLQFTPTFGHRPPPGAPPSQEQQATHMTPTPAIHQHKHHHRHRSIHLPSALPSVVSVQQQQPVPSSVATTHAMFFKAGAPFRILVPENCIGYLVGKGGKTINSISKATNTSIQVVKDHGVQGLRDKIVIIGGPSQEEQQRALAELLRQLQTKPKESFGDADGSISLVTLVPEKAVSVVIGSKGTTINRISKACNCDIQMQSNFRPLVSGGFSDRIVTVRSNEAVNVAMAVTQIHAILTDLYFRGKVAEPDFIFSLRTAQAVEELKKLPGVSSRLAPVESAATPSALVSRHRLSTTEMPRGGAVKAPEDSAIFPPAFLRIPHLLRDVIVSTTLKLSLKILISKSHAAWIIGNFGQRKREIENSSGAVVKVLNSAPANLAPHNQDARVLILKGNPMAVSSAAYLSIGKFEEASSSHQARNNPLYDTSGGEVLYVVLGKQVVEFVAGPNGHLLDTLARDSGAHLRLLRPSDKDANLLAIRGSPDARVTTILLVIQRLIEGQHQTLDSQQQSSDRDTSSTVAHTGSRKRPRPVVEEALRRPPVKRLRPVLKEADVVVAGSTLSPAMAPPAILTSPSQAQRRALEVSAEASFARQSVSTTNPQMMSVPEQFSLCVSFPGKYKKFLRYMGSSWIRSLEETISRRAHSKVMILLEEHPVSVEGVPAGQGVATPDAMLLGPSQTLSQSDVQLHQGQQRADDEQTPLAVSVSGTPLSNSTALLLLHEGLVWVETAYTQLITSRRRVLAAAASSKASEVIQPTGYSASPHDDSVGLDSRMDQRAEGDGGIHGSAQEKSDVMQTVDPIQGAEDPRSPPVDSQGCFNTSTVSDFREEGHRESINSVETTATVAEGVVDSPLKERTGTAASM